MSQKPATLIGRFALIACCGTLPIHCGSSPASPSSTPTSPTQIPINSTAPQPNTVTYVGNSGFLIWVGDRKVLIDALFEGYSGSYTLPASVRGPLLAGQAPFDNIDLILATHDHGDHVGADPVRACLTKNPRAVFVAPAEAAAQVTGFDGRVRALTVADGQRETFQVNDITVSAMPLSHGTPPAGSGPMVNLAYLVGVGGRTFFHTGDIDANIVSTQALQALGIPAAHVDVAFVQHFLLSTAGPIPLVTQGMAPRFVATSHLQYTDGAVNYTQILANFPTALLFRRELENWTIQ